MGVRRDLPRPIRTVAHTWIPLSDGTRLAARLWLPEDACADPVPALLEYLPYRKGDAMAARDARHHPYLAGHGYAAVRVDLRGSGDSGGLLQDEYTEQEIDDACEVIAWLAGQRWCSGRVGMFGISWGGFNALQVAARRPPALQAVMTLCASDDRYADDVHYKGGCVLGTDMLQWAATMLTLCAQPPDPATVGGGWRDAWMRRLDGAAPMIRPWLEHQRRDGYWRRGSVCEEYGRIAVPVYAVGGWSDGYTNAIPRLLEGLPGPRKALVGPWSHAFPYDGCPGPAIGFLQEALRWWDHWLKGVDTGVMAEPPLRAWIQDAVAPATHYAQRPGRWVADAAWPRGHVEHRLPVDDPVVHRSAESTGADAGAWCPDGGDGDWPGDQRDEDARSLALTLAPLAGPLELLGFPEVALTLSADRRQALIAVRLCAVAPDGASLLLSRGLLNLAHRDGHAEPRPLEPGRRYHVSVRLDALGQAVPAGHALRVALSTAYWPWAWPSPERAAITVYRGVLRLPIRPRRNEPEPPPFGPPEWSPPPEVEVLERRPTRRATLEHEIRFDWDVGGRRRLVEARIELDDRNATNYRIVDGDPLSAEVRVRCCSRLARAGWDTRVATDSHMTATATAFLVTQELAAYEGDALVRSRAWSFTFPRDNV